MHLSLVYNATPPLENLEPVVNGCLYPPMVILVSKSWFNFSEVSLVLFAVNDRVQIIYNQCLKLANLYQKWVGFQGISLSLHN